MDVRGDGWEDDCDRVGVNRGADFDIGDRDETDEATVDSEGTDSVVL